jgi:hypothetical protein
MSRLPAGRPKFIPHIELAMSPDNIVWLQTLRQNRLHRIEFRLATKGYPF